MRKSKKTQKRSYSAEQNLRFAEKRLISNKYSKAQSKLKLYEIYDKSIAVNTTTNAPIINNGLNSMAIGAGTEDVVGRRILMTSLHIKGEFIYTPASTIATSAVVRLLIVIDKLSSGGASPSTPFAIELPTNAANYVNAPTPITYPDKFVILYDRRYVLTPKANVASTQQASITQLIDINIDLWKRFPQEVVYPTLVETSDLSPANGYLYGWAVTNSSNVKLNATCLLRYKN